MADPKAWPKSMPIIPPVSELIMKLERCRSPMPRIQWLMQSTAWELLKWDLSERKASGVVLILTKARLKTSIHAIINSLQTYDKHQWFTIWSSVKICIEILQCITQREMMPYFNKSSGTICSILLKLFTVSTRFAFLQGIKWSINTIYTRSI